MVTHIRRSLFLGFTVFLVAKLFLVVPFTHFAGAPRQGDDSYVYLWKGTLFQRGYDVNVSALKDIAFYHSHQSDADPAALARVYMRTHGAVNYLYDAFTTLLLRAGLTPKWVIGTEEIVGALLMSVGFAFLLSTIFGQEAAGIALCFLAFLILPNQGVAYFIPSTLALSLGAILWAIVLRLQWRSAIWVAVSVCLILPAIHPIGKLYSLIGCAIYSLNALASKRRLLSWRSGCIYISFALGIGFVTVLPLASSNFSPPLNAMDGVDKFSGRHLGEHPSYSIVSDSSRPHESAYCRPGLYRHFSCAF